jgi:hypothetical protein
MDRPEGGRAVADQRRDKRQTGETAYDRGSAVAAIAVDKRWPQHRPVQGQAPQMIVGAFLGQRIVGADLDVRADGRDLHDLANPCPGAGIEQGDWRRHVDRLEVLAATAVKDAGTIDDGVDAGKARPPDLGRRIAVEIGGDSLDSWKLVVQRLRVADDRDHVMATRLQTASNCRPMKPFAPVSNIRTALQCALEVGQGEVIAFEENGRVQRPS